MAIGDLQYDVCGQCLGRSRVCDVCHGMGKVPARMRGCTCGANVYDANFGATSATHKSDCAIVTGMYTADELAKIRAAQSG